ncbi:MAG: AMP-binding protein, partial [Pseudomonadota bacterium]|nr:AMP-binding protein [Pseudomonadota bacterium]
SAARDRPDHVVLRDGDTTLTYAGLLNSVDRAATGLMARGLGAGDRVAVMLGHHLEHVVMFFAVMRAGAVLVPINVALKGPSLAYQLTHSAPSLVIADAEFADVLRDPLAQARAEGARADVVWRGAPQAEGHDLQTVLAGDDALVPQLADLAYRPTDLRIILYTSGTTGLPKGVQMSDRMVQSSALSSIWLADITPGSVLHFWDPIYHVFGAEVLVLSLIVPVTLYMVPRFSASRFWTEVRQAGATHVHFVGGVLQLLLKQPASPSDRNHGARIAWGGGCVPDVWTAFEDRFGTEIREGYGMTETSSFSTINSEGVFGSIGRAVDYFDVEIRDEHGQPVAAGVIGEICVRGQEPGVVTTGYYNNAEATEKTLVDGWLLTGDLGIMDAQGFITYKGRKKDSLRRRGENISAFEVERVINDHPEVAESALIGVTNEFGDEDLKLFVRRIDGSTLDGAGLLTWCIDMMPKYQIPRLVSFVDDFRKTPTQRIQKQFLSTALDDADHDAEAS